MRLSRSSSILCLVAGLAFVETGAGNNVFAAELTLGTLVSGTIGEPGEEDVYTFQGTAGQRLGYDAVDADFDSISVRLVAPGGDVVFINGNADSDVAPFMLIEAGMYSLIIDGTGATTGDYAFVLSDLATVPVLALDAPINDSLSPGYLIRWYRIPVAAGQHLFFDSSSSSTSGNVYVYGPYNVFVAQSNISTDFEVTFPQTGTCVVAVSGASPNPISYSLELTDPPATTTPMALGAAVSGILAQPGEIHRFSFQGMLGQRLGFDAMDADFDQITVQLINPSGGVAFINGNADSDVAPFVLNQSGAYTLVIDGIGATTGDYRFRLSDLSTVPLLAVNTEVAQTLDPGYSIHWYRVNVTAGQRLFFDSAGLNSLGNLYLYAANNAFLAQANLAADLEALAPVTGTYILAVSGNGVAPVAYSIEWFTPASLSVPLTLGATVTGSIDIPGEQDFHTFTGALGQQLIYDGLDGDFDPISAFLVGPRGNRVHLNLNSDSDSAPFTLTETGLYTLVIDGTGSTTGDYGFHLFDLAAAPALSLTAPTSGQLSPPDEMDLFRFQGRIGQRIELDAISANRPQANWQLVGTATQNLVVGNIATDLGRVVLPDTGFYTLIVAGTDSTGTAALSYQFQLQDVSDTTAVTASGLNALQTGSLAAGETKDVSFTAPAGLLVYFDSQERVSSSLLGELKDPNGTAVATIALTADAGPFLLPAPGTYTFMIRGNSPAATGNYAFRLLDLNASQALTPGATTSATLDPAYRTDVYKMTGAIGQRLFYDALDNDFDNVGLRLLSPSLALLPFSGNTDSDFGPFTLTTGGSYYLFVESNLAAPADYRFRLLDTAQAPELPLDTPVEGTLDPGLSAAIYRIPASAGQRRLFVDSAGTSSAGSLFVYGPNNDYVLNSSLNGDLEFTISQSGTFLLVIYGNSASPVDYSFHTYTPNDNEEPTGRPMITGIILASGNIELTWSAIPGRTYRVEYKARLTDLEWIPLPGDVVAPGTTATTTDNTLGAAPTRVYRVVQLE